MGDQVQAAAVYARISSDDGTALGVKRQVLDCRQLAAQLGWTVAEEYVDNDVSAFDGKRRPAFEQMVSDLVDGHRDAVLVYHPDRLSRRPIELEQFVQQLTVAGVRHVRFVSGGAVDLGDGGGLTLLRIQSVLAAEESQAKSRRVKRKLDEVAAAGLPHGGPLRPFGFEADKITHRPAEAEVMRALAARFLAGESMRSLTVWLGEENVQTCTGAPWGTTTVKRMLTAPRTAGLRTHRGEVVGPAVWAPIISPQDRNRLLARLAQQRASGRRPPRRYLLSGLLRCGKCGKRLLSAARVDRRRYVCVPGPDQRGCGGVMVTALPVEELVAAAVLFRLDTPELQRSMAGQAAADDQAALLAEQIAEDRQQSAELAEAYGAKLISMSEWLTARKPIEARIDNAERRLARRTRNDALVGLVGNGERLRTQWEGLNLTRQAAIIAAVVDHVVIAATGPTGRRFDTGRVQPVWRL
jgi:site-specific DNA recombinase